jgi:multidrug efflux pump subunit AcrB
LIEVFAKHKVAANLTMIMMIMGGIWAFNTIPAQLDPPRKMTMITVEISWPGASAEDMAELVTTPIENQIRNTTGLRELDSRSINGYMRVLAWFHYDTDMTIALDTIKQGVSSIRNLPKNIETPKVGIREEFQPIALLQVTSDGDINELIPVVQRMEKELLQRGIEKIGYGGLPSEEISILVSSQKLLELGLTYDELSDQISRVSQNVPAGKIGRGQGTKELRSLDQRREPHEFEQILIESQDQLISLGSFSEIVRRPGEGQPIVTRQGRPTIEMELMRKPDTDAGRANEALEQWLAETRETLPAGIEIRKGWDAWQLIGAQIDLIIKNGVTGLLLVILTLFVFLNGRVGLWVMIGIPVSFAMALALLWGVFGYGLAIVCLIGFIMALGIVVDDAIVVAEDSVTHLEQGEPALQAAVGGARRMFIPVIASSLTTLAAFLPLVAVGGELAANMLALPAVLLCVVLASLIECFLVLPGHLAHSLKNYTPPSATSFRARFDAAFLKFRKTKFDPLLHKALDYPGATVCAAVGMAIIAISLVASERVTFSMNIGFSPESLSANVEFSAAATESEKDAFIKHLEGALAAADEENESENVIGWVLRENIAEFNDENQQGVQYVSIEGQYAFKEKRTVEPQEFVNRWRQKVEQPPYVEQLLISVEGGQNNGMSDLELVLSGEDLASLKAGAEELSVALANYPGVSNVMDNLPYGGEQLVFELTPAARSLGLTSQSLGSQLHAGYSGRRVQIFNQNENELEVKLMLPDAERDDLLALQQFPIKTPDGQFVPLANVANLYNRRGIDLIRHTNSKLSVVISADVDEEVNTATIILNDLKEATLPEILSRNNLTFGLTGFSQETANMLATMWLGAKLTLLLIFLILAWVFASYLWPLAIMMAIPFGITGAIFGHWIMGINLSGMSILAILSLTGIVVNDSIVLLSFLKRDVDAGKPIRDALERAVQSRFRAVILTSLTTIAGLLPLMFETASLAAMIIPIAVTICFGLSFATLLILLVIPAYILLLEQFKTRISHLVPKPIENAASGFKSMFQGTQS